MASTMIDLCLSQLDRKDLHYDGGKVNGLDFT